MGEELGKIEKPSVESFAGTRKLILVPLIFAGRDAPREFTEIFDRCWLEITGQIERIEARLGKIARIYHEMVLSEGTEGLALIEKLNPHSHRIVKSKVDQGAELKVADDAELAMETTDWERCLMVAVSENVRSKVAEFYADSSHKRYEHMRRVIDESLAEGEIGLALVREGHRVQFPPDIEVFTIYPPALDEIHRWLRDAAPHVRPDVEADS